LLFFHLFTFFKKHNAALVRFKRAGFAALCVFFALPAYTRDLDVQDYRRRFAQEWADASISVREIRPLLLAALDGDVFLTDVGIAVIFPELTRYSYIRDFVETSALELFYIMHDKGNFSIGKFQMKPAFAVMMERDAPAVCRVRFPKLFQTGRNARETRILRIGRLRSLSSQIEYFAVFLRIMEARFPSMRQTPAFMVRIFAAAYNSGYRQSLETLERKANSHLFPYGSNSPRPQYSYADIALEFFLHASS
jgi:hypothetical protein